MMLLAATSSALGLLASGPLTPPTPPRCALTSGSRRAVMCAESATGGTFVATIDLGEGDGTVVHEFEPYFSSSTLILMRYPVPYTLEAKPLQGVIKVTDTGDGLIEGDVLRAFSTLQLRYDSNARARLYGEGLLGEANEEERRRSWKRWRNVSGGMLSSLARRLGLGKINPEVKPRRCLFVSQGQPYQQVIDALVANTPDKTREIVMVFERPLDT